MALVRLMTCGLTSAASHCGEFGDLFTLFAVFALEHGDGQVAQVFGPRLDGESRHPAQQRRGVEEAVEEPGRMAEQAPFLLQIDVDAAEEDALLADVFLVGADRRVAGDEQGVVALAARAATRVLSFMQLPQNMPAAPAVM